MIRKAEYMIPYHMARCPNYGWKESEEYSKACDLKEKIEGIGACGRARACPHCLGRPPSRPVPSLSRDPLRVRPRRSQGEEALGGELHVNGVLKWATPTTLVFKMPTITRRAIACVAVRPPCSRDHRR